MGFPATAQHFKGEILHPYVWRPLVHQSRQQRTLRRQQRTLQLLTTMVVFLQTASICLVPTLPATFTRQKPRVILTLRPAARLKAENWQVLSLRRKMTSLERQLFSMNRCGLVPKVPDLVASRGLTPPRGPGLTGEVESQEVLPPKNVFS